MPPLRRRVEMAAEKAVTALVPVVEGRAQSLAVPRRDQVIAVWNGGLNPLPCAHHPHHRAPICMMT